MSSKNMTLTDIEKSSKQFKDTHTVSVSGFDGNGQRITAAYVLQVTTKLINDLAIQVKHINNRLDALAEEMCAGFKQVNSRIDRIESRLDNLVVKNNLKE